MAMKVTHQDRINSYNVEEAVFEEVAEPENKKTMNDAFEAASQGDDFGDSEEDIPFE